MVHMLSININSPKNKSMGMGIRKSAKHTVHSNSILFRLFVVAIENGKVTSSSFIVHNIFQPYVKHEWCLIIQKQN